MAEEGFLAEFCSTIRNELGSEISDNILAGYDLQDERDKNRLVIWLAGVVDRMDNHLSAEIRTKIMKNMGYGCAVMHNEHIKAKQKCDEFSSIDEYIAHVEQNPYPGYSARRDGDQLMITYNPKAMKMRCYCGPFNALPFERKVSLTYCLCSAGHVECIWRHVTGKPVIADVICSCISGDDTCKFVVNLNPT